MMKVLPASKRCLFILLTMTVAGYLVVTCTKSLHQTPLTDVQVEHNSTITRNLHQQQLWELEPSGGQNSSFQGNCTPVRQIVFIKTHKTASSTTNTMIQHYGLKHGLVFALPKNTQLFDVNRMFSRAMMLQPTAPPDKGGVFNILANHLRYNRPELQRAVPGARYITILRHPVSKFESTFGYYRAAEHFNLTDYRNPLETFMESPDILMEQHSFGMKNQLRNGMMFTLGFDHKFDDDVLAIDRYITKLDIELDLVLLTEYYDESLLLLKKLLCWDFEDILYIPKGYRSQNRRYNVSVGLAKKILDWNLADHRLYDHFNQTFWSKVAEYGPEFERDLAEFRTRQENFYQSCVAEDKVKMLQNRVDGLVMRHDAPVECELGFFSVIEFYRMLKREYMGIREVPNKYTIHSPKK
ncbi:galactosylceramide sulfotransferase-like [Ptychodera flava]|uniref:galactosylceramide sulfotransferase-like n=1 Tax=Ptychodera flava TaxID=63121 RepID=UPI00396A87D8